MSLVLVLSIVGVLLGAAGIVVGWAAGVSSSDALGAAERAQNTASSASSFAVNALNHATRARRNSLANVLDLQVKVVEDTNGLLGLFDPSNSRVSDELPSHTTTLGQLLALLVNASDAKVEPEQHTDSALSVAKKQPVTILSIDPSSFARQPANDDMVDAFTYAGVHGGEPTDTPEG